MIFPTNRANPQSPQNSAYKCQQQTNAFRKQINCDKNYSQNYTNIQTEYQLCSTFMKMTNNQFVQKQMQLMINSQDLIDEFNKIKPRIKFDMDCSLNDLDKSIESSTKIFDTSDINFGDDCLSIKSKSKRISRTNKLSSSNVNKTTTCFGLTHYLNDIKENCSRNTFNKINQIINEHSELQKKIIQLETKQKPGFLKRTGRGIIPHKDNLEQTVILSAKNSKLQKQNLELQEKLKIMQERIKIWQKMATKQTQKRKQQNKEQIKKNFEIMKKFLFEKQKILTQKSDVVQKCQQNIFKALQQNFIENGCQKCCSLIKKIKDSLMNYRNCLQQEFEKYDQLWSDYKQQKQSKTENHLSYRCKTQRNY